MKLGIISDCHHYYNEAGKLCSLTSVVWQFEKWAQMFDEVIICAPFLYGTPPVTYQTPYKASNIRLLPISNAGGNTIQAKLILVQKIIEWWRTLKSLIRQVDAVHVRCPNNISILGLIAIQRTRLLRQAVYTGSWLGKYREPLTYKAQRIFLKYFFRGPVAVYGHWPNQPDHIVPSFSPPYNQADWDMESHQVAQRVRALHKMKHLALPIHLLSIGSLNRNKNQILIIDAIQILVKRGIDCRLDLLGDGDQRGVLEKHSNSLGLADRIFFHGNVSQSVVRQFYRKAIFVLQAPYAEGFGKVPVEALCHGVVPILSDVDMSQQIVGAGIRGRCFPQGDAQAVAGIVIDLAQNPEMMVGMIENGREYARSLNLEAWQQHLREMLDYSWGTHLIIRSAKSEK
jgi:glycosyltransferase involved in cell wall biosynthesis